MEFADNEAYKRVYGEVTGDTYDKHKKQIQRLSKHPDNAIHRPLRTSKPTTTSNSFSYFMDCLYNSKPRHKEDLKQTIINYVDELRFKGMSTKRAIRAAATKFEISYSTIEKWTYL